MESTRDTDHSFGIEFGQVPRGDLSRRTIGAALTDILGDFGGGVFGVGDL